MAVIHFMEDIHHVILTQLVDNIPEVDANVKIKGRKGKVVRVEEVRNQHFHVFIKFEPVVKKPAMVNDKRKRR